MIHMIHMIYESVSLSIQQSDSDLRMSRTIFAMLAFGLFFFAILPALSSADANSVKNKYKFLLFGSITDGSHYINLAKLGRALVRHGHGVVSLMSSSNPSTLWENDVGLFSHVVFNSSYTKQNWVDGVFFLSSRSMKGLLSHSRELNRLASVAFLRDCDALFNDSATMKRLHDERFDMLIADDSIPCSPLLAQALDIPFVLYSVSFAIPTKHGQWAGLPVNPSYIPDVDLELTDRMTIRQRVKNVLAHYYYSYFSPHSSIVPLDPCDELKVKYNIRPEISTFESHKQALLYFVHGSFGLEYPQPMQPNMIPVLYTAGSHHVGKIDGKVLKFLDSASAGVVVFSLGYNIQITDRDKAQLFADTFATLPYRVLWMSKVDMTGIPLGNNTMIVKWLPTDLFLEHANVRAYVTHCGAFSKNEALWNGVPIVGIPLLFDQGENINRIEAQGAGLRLDIATLTLETLSGTIRRVMEEPRFRENAQRISKIMHDLQGTENPIDNMVRWILHVTRLGGEHLRPAVMELNVVQRYLLDVYLLIGVVVVAIFGVSVSGCRFGWKCLFDKGKDGKYKKE